ncbi:ABC transporter [Cryptosporidium ryanae]|uniref:ABC transporter n=1 Tax=Cryptosporidium ryanae TaxID=515981 RepID=UPI00351A0EDC|nr:ABC transporter [Cryptosporidium ryanae]
MWGISTKLQVCFKSSQGKAFLFSNAKNTFSLIFSNNNLLFCMRNYPKLFHPQHSCNFVHVKKATKSDNNAIKRKSNLVEILKKCKIVNEHDATNLDIVTKYLWPENPQHRKRIVLSLLSLGIGKMATIQAPLLLSRLINNLEIMSSTANLNSIRSSLNALLLIGSYGIARISSSGFSELRNALFSSVSQSACREVSLKAFHHFHNLSSLDFIQNHRTGELITIITRGSKSVSQLLNIMIFQIVPTTAEFILVLGILLRKVGHEVALITLATMLGYMDFTRRITHKRTLYRKDMNNSEQKSNGLLSDSLTNIETLKYLNCEKQMYDLYSKYQRIYMNSNIKVQTSLAFLNFGQNLIFTGGLLSTMLLTTKKILSGMIPIGSIVLVTSLLFQLAIPLNFIGMIYRETKLTMIDLKKLNDYMSMFANNYNLIENKNYNKALTVPEKVTSNSQEFLELYGKINDKGSDSSIKFEDISFGYKGTSENNNYSDKMVINNLSLDIPLGKRIGLVGSSGSGKTTLSKLIFRIFEPDSGKIKIFDQNINDFNIKEYRKCISILPQDVLLLNMSVIDNLKLANSSASLEDVKAACKLAGIHDRIVKMEKGYNTIVGERGSSLSGGEKQRLGFARLLLKKSPVWILDEPTSALDLINHNFVVKMLTMLHKHSTKLNKYDLSEMGNTTKYGDILETIKCSYKDPEVNHIVKLIDDVVRYPLTIIVIAHRLSTVRDFEKIAYIENGNVKEVGSHDDLIKNKMHYYKLWNKQHVDNMFK